MKLKRFYKELTTVVVVLSLVLSTFIPAFAANITKVQITTKVTKMDISSSKQLTAVTTPKGAKVTWKSSNVKVASVSKTGKVSALAAGTVKVTATAGKKSDSVTIKVVKSNVKATPTTAPATETKKANPNEILVNGDIEKGLDPWTSSYGASVVLTDKEKTSGKNGLYISARTSTGDGPKQDITGKIKPGATYQFSCRVKYTTGPDSKKFQFDIQNGKTWQGISIMGGADVNKGEWGTVTGTYTIPADADTSMTFLFIETPWTATPDPATDLFDFYVDDISFIAQ